MAKLYFTTLKLIYFDYVHEKKKKYGKIFT